MSSGLSLSTLDPTGVWVRGSGLAPPGWTRPGEFLLWSPTPPHAALALHTNFPCVNVASIITDSPSGGERARGMPQWAWPGMAPPQNQAAGTRVLAFWDLGRGS